MAVHKCDASGCSEIAISSCDNCDHWVCEKHHGQHGGDRHVRAIGVMAFPSLCLFCAEGFTPYPWVNAVLRFKPDAECINALPRPLRKYIHDLETRCDPTGDVRMIAFQKDLIDALTVKLKNTSDELAAARKENSK